MLVNGEWLLTAERAALHLPTATAVIADVQFGHGHDHRRAGEAVPAASLGETLAAVAALQEAYDIRRLVIAGDAFEDARINGNATALVTWLKDRRVELAGVISGNHDSELANPDSEIPICPKGLRLGSWWVVHGNGEIAPGHRLVHGHLHPCFRWNSSVLAPCYLVAPQRIILPAYSRATAGVNVLREPKWRNYKCFVISGEEVLDFGRLGDLQRVVRASK
jgi:putative SbcD/Mre11-related phosphoesterase